MAQNAELEGIKKMRSGLLFLIIVPLLMFIALIFIMGTLFAAMASIGSPSSALGLGVSSILVSVILFILSAVLGVVGILRIRTSFGILKSLGKDVGIGGTGATLMLIALILYLIGGILILVLVGVAIIVIAYLLALIGIILLGVGFYKVGSTYNESTTKIGGILSAIPIGILTFIGYILVYVGLDKIENILTSPGVYQGYQPPTYQQSYQPSQPTYQPPPQAPQIYQTGQGVIRGNGYAQIPIYSSVQVNIVSARIEGTTISSSTINPIITQVGQNEVVIYFGNVSSLTPGGQYKIILKVNVGGSMVDITTYATYQP